jgi:ubiquinone/menaquinone biosynthesis C-methylase UbiE
MVLKYYNYINEEASSDFKIGDKILYVGNSTYKNRTGKIIQNTTGDLIGVEFDEPIPGGHFCNGTGKWGYCSYVEKKSLRLQKNMRKLTNDDDPLGEEDWGWEEITESVNTNKVNNYYGWLTDIAKGDENITVGWKTKQQQDGRFEKLIDIGIKSNDSLLDFGCGLSELFNYLKNKNINVKYTGIDINPKFLQMSMQKYGEDVNFKVQKIKTIEDIKGKYDWCIVSGTFNYGHTFEDIVYELEYLYNISNKGITFNLLSEKTQEMFEPGDEGEWFEKKLWKMKGGLITFDPEKFQEYMRNKYGNIKMTKGYLDSSGGSDFNDFTIYIYKI